MSDRKFRLKQSAIFGTIVGIVVFTIFYYLDPSLKYIFIIPFGTLMGWGYTYTVRDSDLESDDGSDKD
ncbi:MAG: hypothetical protein ACOX1N_05270 [Candidatus Methanomethylophilaceae archaeon]|jgi:hypothetical protein